MHDLFLVRTLATLLLGVAAKEDLQGALEVHTASLEYIYIFYIIHMYIYILLYVIYIYILYIHIYIWGNVTSHRLDH